MKVRMSANAITLVGGSAKRTLLQVQAAAGRGVEITEIYISMNAADPNTTGVLIEVERQSGSPTTFSNGAPVKDNDSDGDTPQSDFIYNITGTQPTSGDLLLTQYLNPSTYLAWVAPGPGQGIKVGAGDKVGIAYTSATTPAAAITVVVEE